MILILNGEGNPLEPSYAILYNDPCMPTEKYTLYVLDEDRTTPFSVSQSSSLLHKKTHKQTHSLTHTAKDAKIRALDTNAGIHMA